MIPVAGHEEEGSIIFKEHGAHCEIR